MCALQDRSIRVPEAAKDGDDEDDNKEEENPEEEPTTDETAYQIDLFGEGKFCLTAGFLGLKSKLKMKP